MTTTTGIRAAKGLPAPLVVLAGLFVAWLLGRAYPLPAVASPLRWGGGVLLMALGSLFGFSAFHAMRQARTSPNPYRPTTAIVTGGSFRFSRNPMYVSFALYFAGLSLLLGLTWGLALLPIVVLAIHLGSVVPEERYLASEFGEEYRAYRAKVRPWL